MPLIIQGVVVDDNHLSVTKIAKKFPDLKEGAKQFCSQPVQEVPSAGLLYVIQRECANVFPSDENVTVVGSEDATTCHIVIVRNRGAGMTSIAHLDGCGMKDALTNMIKAITRTSTDHVSNQIDLHIFGGFLDKRGISEEISSEILEIIQRQPTRINLSTACITDLNDIEQDGQHRPIIYGVAINVKTGKVFRATFPDKGPEGSLRHTRNFGDSKEVAQVYDSSVGEIEIGPFDYKPWKYASFFQEAPDHVILKYLSTSPHCEPAGFCREIRATMKYITDNPSPLTTVFPGGLPHRYMRSGNKWERIK